MRTVHQLFRSTYDQHLQPVYDRHNTIRRLLSTEKDPVELIIPQGTLDPASIDKHATMTSARTVLNAFNAALTSNDVQNLANCFYEQAYWRDIVALTSHLRTMEKPRVVATALLQMVTIRGLEGKVEIMGDPQFAVMNPFMMFIDYGISFQTSSPALACAGKMVLLPVKEGDQVAWKIWVLSTWVEDLIEYTEKEELLSLPGRSLNGNNPIKSDVLIVGAGTGLMTAARLKAFGVENLVIDRNANISDSWAKRYDSLKFHVPISNCEMPYKYYPKELQSPYRLSKNDVAQHLQNYAKDFHLNVMTSTTVRATVFSITEKQWTVEVEVARSDNVKTIICKHLVQTTGLGSGKPNLPLMKDSHLYNGLSIHSTRYRNVHELRERGVKTVAIVGSANTAFDVMQDCWEAGLKTTMVVRSPTYIFPYEYEPDRYLGLSKAGFPVLDSMDPSVNVLHHLFERGGGHYIDVGGTELIVEGKINVRCMVEPIAYTEAGLLLSDNSALDADAVIWCTGFADKNVRETAKEMLGQHLKTGLLQEEALDPEGISARLDASWGVDHEGEVRGVWKRHLNMENFWAIGGTIQHQRWWSRPMAQQIKLALEGVLPPAYRGTPDLGWAA
ncbi:FAD/NAD(P)-binding domain-containing protein [Bimuria novae-zelandiae CBS 107.79]|uniref:FAD/NAD(P)-binding domain-containing protein n=1 Tax=Bimuria novae-zelandiae CBS 107.79 TaxID=1447943 RepID=A0A6A5V9R9_9PLEO|nr:FAD/NAD(P)-binding domain-containing protein [Bimuria novae-zelandiae CBS 107.79]